MIDINNVFSGYWKEHACPEHVLYQMLHRQYSASSLPFCPSTYSGLIDEQNLRKTGAPALRHSDIPRGIDIENYFKSMTTYTTALNQQPPS